MRFEPQQADLCGFWQDSSRFMRRADGTRRWPVWRDVGADLRWVGECDGGRVSRTKEKDPVGLQRCFSNFRQHYDLALLVGRDWCRFHMLRDTKGNAVIRTAQRIQIAKLRRLKYRS